MNDTDTPVIHMDNIVGAPGTTLAGLAAAMPELVHIVSSFTLPDTVAGWLQLGLGILAVFAKL